MNMTYLNLQYRSAQKNSTYSTTLPTVTPDSEKVGRVLVELVEKGRILVENPDIRPVVQEFLANGGQASLQRFLAEFPEAAGGST